MRCMIFNFLLKKSAYRICRQSKARGHDFRILFNTLICSMRRPSRAGERVHQFEVQASDDFCLTRGQRKRHKSAKRVLTLKRGRDYSHPTFGAANKRRHGFFLLLSERKGNRGNPGQKPIAV
jgi:hypothetical protein